MALSDGMRASGNIEDMRDQAVNVLPMLLMPMGLTIAAGIWPMGWRYRIAVWVAIWSLVLPAFL